MNFFTFSPKSDLPTEEQNKEAEKKLDSDSKSSQTKLNRLQIFLGVCAIIAYLFDAIFIHVIYPHRRGIARVTKRSVHIVFHAFKTALIPDEQTARPIQSPKISPDAEAFEKAQAAIAAKRKEKLAVLENTTHHSKTETQQISPVEKIDNTDVPIYDYAPRAGNSADRIARKHGMYLEELFDLNPWLRANPNHIEYGRYARKIKVKAWKLYIMSEGDSFRRIAYDFNVSMKSLDKANKKLHRRVRPGKVMVIPCPENM